MEPTKKSAQYEAAYQKYYKQLNDELPGAYTDEEIQQQAHDKADNDEKLNDNFSKIGQMFHASK